MFKRKIVPVRWGYSFLLPYMVPPAGILYIKIYAVRNMADVGPKQPIEDEDYKVDLRADPEEVMNTILELSKLLPDFYSRVDMWRQFWGGKLSRTIWGKGVTWTEPSKDAIKEMREFIVESHIIDNKSKVLRKHLFVLWITAPFRKIGELIKSLSKK